MWKSVFVGGGLGTQGRGMGGDEVARVVVSASEVGREGWLVGSPLEFKFETPANRDKKLHRNRHVTQFSNPRAATSLHRRSPMGAMDLLWHASALARVLPRLRAFWGSLARRRP